MNPTLLHTLDEQPLTVIGDIHGESQALDALLDHLQKNPETRDRLMVFIGDLCDRGPDSVGVIRRVRELVEQGRALAILGNHEINLLANDAKDGSGWFFDSRESSDTPFYAPFSRASARERPEIRDFLCSLPLAIRMPGLRIVHAAWDPASIQTIAGFPLGNILELIREQELNLIQAAKTDDLHARYRGELDRWGKQLEDPNDPPPYLDAVADYESLEQRLNPIKRLTSGIEARSPQPFFSGNRWRYSDRTAWWDQDDDPTPVLIGHYWRLFEPPKPSTSWRYGRLFEGVAPVAWHGRHRQAFCIDYSVGARWRTRKFPEKNAENRYRLAAMLWPERILVFDDGARIPTLDTASVA
ncbi:metallophosphoesterase [Castellaniella ginsengisoli]|uniref:Metallophosphoesterase n=1 Tax=Castellaniella ginsengisoli TaxID=546114 RepID=A0AB39F0Y2_9BURK